MTNGIYGYYDVEKEYVIYIGQDSNINKNTRHYQHLLPSRYNEQFVNRILQNNPKRYVYFKLLEGNYTKEDIDNFEQEAIKIFKTYKYNYPQRSVFNFTQGGQGLNGVSFSEETRKKLSNCMKGKNNHMYGKNHLDKSKEKISKSHNTSGYYNVYKHNCNKCKQGFTWDYRYTNNSGKRKVIKSVDINKLEKKVKSKGLKWKKFK